MVQRDDINVPMIATAGVVSVLLTIAAVFAVQSVYFRRASSETERKVILVSDTSADSRLAEQEAVLTRYSWLRQDEQRVTIPIKLAMQLVVEDYRNPTRSTSVTRSTTAGDP